MQPMHRWVVVLTRESLACCQFVPLHARAPSNRLDSCQQELEARHVSKQSSSANIHYSTANDIIDSAIVQEKTSNAETQRLLVFLVVFLLLNITSREECVEYSG